MQPHTLSSIHLWSFVITASLGLVCLVVYGGCETLNGPQWVTRQTETPKGVSRLMFIILVYLFCRRRYNT